MRICLHITCTEDKSLFFPFIPLLFVSPLKEAGKIHPIPDPFVWDALHSVCLPAWEHWSGSQAVHRAGAGILSGMTQQRENRQGAAKQESPGLKAVLRWITKSDQRWNDCSRMPLKIWAVIAGEDQVLIITLMMDLHAIINLTAFPMVTCQNVSHEQGLLELKLFWQHINADRWYEVKIRCCSSESVPSTQLYL